MKTLISGWILICCSLIFLPASWIWADGGYVSKSESTAISADQRAIIIKNGNEISMTFSTAYMGDGGEFGWIIPTPVAPSLKDVSLADVIWDTVLDFLDEYTAPHLYKGKGWGPLQRTFKPLVSAHGQRALNHHEVRIIDSGHKSALNSWLRENSFQIDTKASEILDTYLKKNWAFVAVKLNPAERRLYQGEYLSALTIRYRYDRLISPLLVSAISTDHTVEISLYVIAESTVIASNLPTSELRFDGNLIEGVDPREYMRVSIRRTAEAPDRSGMVVTWRGEVALSSAQRKLVQRLMKTPFPRSKKLYLTHLETVMSPLSMGEDISIELDSNPKEFEVRMFPDRSTCNAPSMDPRGNSLIAAAQLGDIVKVRELLQAGISANTKCGWTPLTKAAGSGHVEVVQLLLQKGADVNMTGGGSTALMRAALYGDSEIVRILLDEGADVNAKDKNGRTALLWAVRGGHKNVIQVLLEAGADVGARNELSVEALSYASAHCLTDFVNILLQAGADVNAKNEHGSTAIMRAALEGCNEAVLILLNAGANIDAKNTALVFAAMSGYTETVQILLEAGADVGARWGNKTALMRAARNGYTEVVKLLIQAKANLDALDDYGRTALIMAAEAGSAEVVEIIVQAGADVNARDEWGSTALKYAREGGYTEIVDILIQGAED